MEHDHLLFEAAATFLELEAYQLKLTIGRKGNAEEVYLSFRPNDFHHLAGLHKLTDINQVYKQNAKIVYQQIIAGKIQQSDIVQSDFYHLIEERLLILRNLKIIFCNFSNMFKFRKLMIPNSRIRWKFLLEFEYAANAIGYLFLDEYRRHPGNYVCVTDFRKTTSDYGSGQIKYTLLQIAATNLKTKEREIWYTSDSYKRTN